jgi:hypothetical protein
MTVVQEQESKSQAMSVCTLLVFKCIRGLLAVSDLAIAFSDAANAAAKTANAAAKANFRAVFADVGQTLN